MATERVQKPRWQPSSQKKQSPIVPPLVDSQTEADSLLSPKVPVSGVKSKAERDAIRRSLFEKWAGAAPQPQSESEVLEHSGSSTATETIQGQKASQAKDQMGIDIQAKLTIGKPGDKYEQEADRVAAEVVQQMNMPASQQPGQSESVQGEEMEDQELMMKPEANTIQRENISEDDNDKLVMKKEVAIVQCEAMPNEEDELMMKPMVQRQPNGGMAATPDLEASINQARGNGQPLANSIRESIEQAFGADFSGVKVHTDAQCDQLNQSIQARAFTTGQDIFFRSGEYNPESRGGQELIAHELTHVVQQNRDAVQRMPYKKDVRELDETERIQIYNDFLANKRQNKLKEIVWEGHLKAIADVCKKHHYTIAIRETGPLSIKRIAEGAKAKPHTILEKSIKQSSVEKGHDTQAEAVLRNLELWDLDGFVGHWNTDHQLIGLRIDNMPENVRQQINVTQDQDIPYVPLDLNAPNGGTAIDQLKNVQNWKQYLYTGDYDLHEVYSAGAGGGQIPEATPEKVRLLDRLNQGIQSQGENSTMRGGLATLQGDPKRVHVEGEYAMFQHGDQATYRMNQHLEAQELESNVAQLVRAVATESDEPIAWCRMGEWFVTLNKYEHDVFRMVHNINKPHTWSEKEASKQKRTEKYR